MDDKKMIEALNRIAKAQEESVQRWGEIRNELCEIRESIKRVHNRLDQTARETTINTERIATLKEQAISDKKDLKNEIDIAHESIRRRDGTLKWVFAAVIIPTALAILAIFKPVP